MQMRSLTTSYIVCMYDDDGDDKWIDVPNIIPYVYRQRHTASDVPACIRIEPDRHRQLAMNTRRGRREARSVSVRSVGRLADRKQLRLLFKWMC